MTYGSWKKQGWLWCKNWKKLLLEKDLDTTTIPSICNGIENSQLVNGNSITPLFIFPWVQFKDHFIRDGSIGVILRVGWQKRSLSLSKKIFITTANQWEKNDFLAVGKSQLSYIHWTIALVRLMAPYCTYRL